MNLPFFKHCVTSKQYKLKFRRSNTRSKNILDLVHSHIWESSDTFMGSVMYLVTFIDNYSRRC